ncbi:MAG TPA: type II toxin-antitoxin system RelE/ParE family toxin [Nitrospirota bacterium]
MASYELIVKPSVEKDLRSLPKPVVKRLLERMDHLKETPFTPQSLKLTGAENLYRVRVGDYRIVYGVDVKARLITIHYVRHRREAYRSM